jgi:hypothetical protein
LPAVGRAPRLAFLASKTLAYSLALIAPPCEQNPRVLYRGYHREADVRAREEARVLGATNASRGALPTAGKREGIYF